MGQSEGPAATRLRRALADLDTAIQEIRSRAFERIFRHCGLGR